MAVCGGSFKDVLDIVLKGGSLEDIAAISKTAKIIDAVTLLKGIISGGDRRIR